MADYQVPAVMDVLAPAAPMTLSQGQLYYFDLTVRNAAQVVAVNGADELDYSLSLMGDIGDLLGEASGMTLPLESGKIHQVLLNTETPGIKSGSILVASDSRGAANGIVTIDLTYEVIAIPEPSAWLILLLSGAAFVARRRAVDRK